MSADRQQAASPPDLIGPVIGFRQWRLAEEGLQSIACAELWQKPVLDARCLLGSHPHEPAPASACSCGVHAWYDPCPRTASAPSRDYIAGTVVMWGPIELHVSGMRAQHCRIIALALPLSRWGKRDRVIDVAKRFCIPAARHRDLERIAGERGVWGARPGPTAAPANSVPPRFGRPSTYRGRQLVISARDSRPPGHR